MNVDDLIVHLTDTLDTVGLKQCYNNDIIRTSKCIEHTHVNVRRVVDHTNRIICSDFRKCVLQNDILPRLLIADHGIVRLNEPHIRSNEVNVRILRMLQHIACRCTIHQNVGQCSLVLIRSEEPRRIALFVVVDKQHTQVPRFSEEVAEPSRERRLSNAAFEIDETDGLHRFLLML